MEFDVSVIIVNYKTTNLIIDCLKSIFNLTRNVTFEIIVVDNDSEMDFDTAIQSHFPHFKWFKFIHLNRNLGFGKANNEGIKIAEGRNIFFLNPDTVLLNNAIYILSNFLDNQSNAGACGGNLFSIDMKPSFSFKRLMPGIWWEFNELLNLVPLKLIYGSRLTFETKEYCGKVGYITGADLMVKRSVIETVGGFSDKFFMYYEETDLCARIKKSGWDIYCVPQANIQHLEGRSFGSNTMLNVKKIEMIEESREIYYNQNLRGINYSLSSILYQTYLLTRKYLMKRGKKKEYYKIRYDMHMKYHKQLLNI